MSDALSMPQEMEIPLKKLLTSHEGDKLDLYIDTKGNATIGIGRNLTGRGILPSERDLMYKNDKDFFYTYLMTTYSWYPELNIPRKCALIDLCFSGTKTFETFKKMILAFEKKDYKKAADEILDSLYAKEVLGRAEDLAHIILTGSFFVDK